MEKGKGFEEFLGLHVKIGKEEDGHGGC